jgi:hypothetical protein
MWLAGLPPPVQTGIPGGQVFGDIVDTLERELAEPPAARFHALRAGEVEVMAGLHRRVRPFGSIRKAASFP